MASPEEEHILAAPLENIRAQAIPPAWRLSGLKFRNRLIARRMYNNLLAVLVGGAVIGALAMLFDIRAIPNLITGWFGVGIAKVSTWKADDAASWLDSFLGAGAGALLTIPWSLQTTRRPGRNLPRRWASVSNGGR
jgi:hypothetical protein